MGNPGSYWNFFFVLLFLILGVVFIFVGFELRPFGIMFVLIALLYIINDGEGGVFSYVTDPIVFIVFLFTILVSWMGSDPEQEKEYLLKNFDARTKPYKMIILTRKSMSLEFMMLLIPYTNLT